ncbi:MAG: hypothetical protein ACE5HB_06740, partial [Terriglobia bacterium]
MASTDVFPLDPNYAVRRGMISGVLEALADSGRRFGRQKRPNLRTWELEYRGRPTSEVEQLRDFYHRLRNDYFVLDDKVYNENAGAFVSRRFPVEWASELDESLFTPDGYNAPILLREAVGKRVATPLFLNTHFDKWTGANLDDWSAVPAGGAKEEVDVVSGMAYRITGDGVAATRGLITQLASSIIKPGVEYTVVARAKRSAGLLQGNLAVDLQGTGVDTAGLVVGSGTLTENYTRYMGQLIAASDIGSSVPADLALRVFLASTPTNAESAFIDELLIFEGASALDNLFPDPDAGIDSVFLNAEQAVALQGVWTPWGDPKQVGRAKLNANVNSTDFLEWMYSGYGFRLWAPRLTNLGIHEVLIDGVPLEEIDLQAWR